MTQSDHSSHHINIAIDGPAGAGKSTVARLVAQELGYVYIDTGAMYRAISLHMSQAGIQPDEAAALSNELKRVTLELKPEGERQFVILNGEDVTDAIRTSEISRLASDYAKSQVVREQLVHMQRQMATRKGVVMDGRDIGTHVLPDAELKWFITASVEERARRRYAEWKDKENASLETFIQEIADRDRQDETREVSPLRQAEDAVLLDTTGMAIADVVSTIVERANLQKSW
ncbi:cytidylate kinase [Paenibacillus alvei TS-15]|uniref:Cytidylate kinase n=1 Tax=Paenibacillus alvei TS-15 TaxID=1117108 RepID=S9UB69_PAEAL|nr:(d)CMP kinase [Paenibacillus alvei]EPY07700.1 cytidylate kinase [Paenibacillus alvei TS-15]